jgi:hypothetical protein
MIYEMRLTDNKENYLISHNWEYELPEQLCLMIGLTAYHGHKWAEAKEFNSKLFTTILSNIINLPVFENDKHLENYGKALDFIMYIVKLAISTNGNIDYFKNHKN